MIVRLSAALPRGDHNGLSTIVPALVARPADVHVIVALVDCRRIVVNTESGESTPEVRIRAIEAAPGATTDGEELRRLFSRARERRTGKQELALDLSPDKSPVDGAP